jgi:hypothetical protein
MPELPACLLLARTTTSLRYPKKLIRLENMFMFYDVLILLNKANFYQAALELIAKRLVPKKPILLYNPEPTQQVRFKARPLN